mgnify:CR=1 FL=1
MERQLHLLQDEKANFEKRVFPRFPFTYLIFKAQDRPESRGFEVINISSTGMQLKRKDGGHTYKVGNDIYGNLHWKGAELEVKGSVRWVHGTDLGIEFDHSDEYQNEVQNFLSVKNIISGLRAVHQAEIGVEIPSSLKYWVRSDGPVDLFVWRHQDGELSKFQLIIFKDFVEWIDGQGVRTGKVMNKRFVETPLHLEDEFMFKMDKQISMRKLNFAEEIIDHIPESYLSKDCLNFLKLKIHS